MKLVQVVEDPNSQDRLGVVVEPHPSAHKGGRQLHRAFAQLKPGSDWHELTQAGALSGGVYPTKKGVGQRVEELVEAWRLGRQDNSKSHNSQPQPSQGAPSPGGNGPPNPFGGAPGQGGGAASPFGGGQLMQVLAAMLRASMGAVRQASAMNAAMANAAPKLAPPTPEVDPFGDAVSWSSALDVVLSDQELPQPPQLPAPEPPVDGADVKKDCDEFDQSLAALNAHLDEARYRAGGL